MRYQADTAPSWATEEQRNVSICFMTKVQKDRRLKITTYKILFNPVKNLDFQMGKD